MVKQLKKMKDTCEFLTSELTLNTGPFGGTQGALKTFMKA